MLRQNKRLSAALVREVLARGRGRKGEVLSVKVLPAFSPFRCAVVVSKKVAKTAVMRNKLRRSVYRALEGSSLPPSGYAILFVQVIPKDHMTKMFLLDIKKLLHV
jgi:ribonuclease P protein component